jgi:hypothetical protein
MVDGNTSIVGGQVVQPGQAESVNPSDIVSTLSNNVTAASQNGPTLSPGTALALGASGGDVAGNANAVAAGQYHHAIAQAHDQVNQGSGGILGDILGAVRKVAHPFAVVAHDTGISTALSDAGKAFNYPLSIAQHEYRYFHDVEARYGMMAAVEEGLVVAGAAAATTAATGGNIELGLLGAEAAGTLLGQIQHHQSWIATANGNTYRDPHTGDVVSFGRDIANKLGVKGGAFGTLSGVIDGIGDLSTDPLALGGKVVGLARSADGLGGILKNTWHGYAMNPENVDLLYNSKVYTGFRRAVHQIAGMDSGQIVSHSAQWARFLPIADRLGNAKTDEDVLQVFREVLKTKQLQTTDTLPSLSFVTKATKGARDIAANFDGTLANNAVFGPARWIRRFANVPGARYDPELKKFTGNIIDFDSTDGAVDLHRMLRFAHTKQVADDTVTSFIHAAPGDRKMIFQNAVMDTVARVGIRDFERNMNKIPPGLRDDLMTMKRAKVYTPEDFNTIAGYWDYRMSIMRNQSVMKDLKTHLDEIMGNANPGQGGVYGIRLNGQASRPVLEFNADGTVAREHNMAILQNQTGKGVVPSFTQVKRMAAELSGAYNFTGKLDDFAYHSITQGFFKPLVLLSLSYANHIALAELIPNIFRLGLRRMIAGQYYVALGKLGHAVGEAKDNEREINALTGFLYRMFNGIPHNNDHARWAIQMAQITEAHMVTAAVSTADNWSKEISTSARVEHGFRNFLSATPMKMKRSGKDFTILNKSVLGRDVYLADWQAALRELARDPYQRLGAREYLSLMKQAAKNPKMPKLPLPAAGADLWYHGTATRWKDDKLDPYYAGSGGGINYRGPGLYLTKNRGVATDYVNKDILATDEDRGAEQAAHDFGEVFQPPGRDPHIYALRWTADHPPHLLNMDEALPTDVRLFMHQWVNEHLVKGLPSVTNDTEEVARIMDPVLKALSDREVDAGQVYEAIQTGLRHLYTGDRAEELPELMDLAQELHNRFGYDGLSYRGGLNNIGAGPEHDVMVLWPVAHGDVKAVKDSQAARMNANLSLSDHEQAMQELRENKDAFPTDRPDSGDEHADLAHWLHTNGGPQNARYLSPDTRKILAAHQEPGQQFTAEALRRLEDETIPRLQGKVGQAEQNMENAGAVPQFPVEVADHASVSDEQRAAVQRWMARHDVTTKDDAINGATEKVAQALRERGGRDPDWAGTFGRSGRRSERNPTPGSDAYDDWAREIMESSIYHAQDRPEVLNHLVNGRAPSINTLKGVPEEYWPEMVKGRTVNVSASSRVQRIADLGFRKLINPYVNTISRAPIFMAEYLRTMDRMKPMIDSGVIDETEAVQRSLDISSNRMIRFIHNLHDRTQLSETVRNWMPFYFAQEQAYKRMGRLLVEDPGAARRMMMMTLAVGQMAAHQHNAQGQGYFTFPGGTWLARGTTEAFGAMGLGLVNVDGGGFDTSLSSANVIFPLSSGFKPDVSPIAALSAKALQGAFPELTPTLEKVVGGPTMSSGLISQLIPNTTLNRIVTAAQGMNGTPGRAFASSMMQAMQLAVYQQNVAYEKWVQGGRRGPEPDIVPTQQQAADPQKMQDFINRIKNQTFILYMTNAVLGFFSPTSPSVTVKDFGFRAELNKDITKAGSVAKGMTNFLLKHPEATPYTVFQSATKAGGAIPESVPGEAWLNANRTGISQYPNVMPYMLPNLPNGYSPAVYDEQLAQGIRIKRDPMSVGGPNSFMTQLYVAAGNQVYYQAVKQHEDNIKAIGNNSMAKGREYTAWDDYKNQLQTQAPVWAQYGPLSNFKATQMRESITQIRQMVAKNAVPNTQNGRNLASLLGYFEQANQQYVAASETFNYNHNETLVTDGWKSYLNTVIQQHPELSSAIRAIFFDAVGAVPLNG